MMVNPLRRAGFVEESSSTDATTDELLEATPTPVPTPTPIPTPTPNPIKIIIEIPTSRLLKKAAEEEGKTRGISPMRVKKGDITVLRQIRLRPREELGELQKMKQFNIEELYDLSSIPDDAIREFELFLKCTNEGARATVARFIHDKYMGK